MLGQYRVKLAGVTEGELAQQGSHGGGGIHRPEEGLHAAGADQVDIVDVVRAGAHARDQGGQFRGRVGCPGLDPRRLDVNLVVQQPCQACSLGQGHHRDQACAGHEIVLVEHRRVRAERVGHLHWKCLS
jgi:hypothetical protein